MERSRREMVKIDYKSLHLSGRGEFTEIMPNTTQEGKEVESEGGTIGAGGGMGTDAQVALANDNRALQEKLQMEHHRNELLRLKTENLALQAKLDESNMKREQFELTLAHAEQARQLTRSEHENRMKHLQEIMNNQKEDFLKKLDDTSREEQVKVQEWLDKYYSSSVEPVVLPSLTADQRRVLKHGKSAKKVDPNELTPDQAKELLVQLTEDSALRTCPSTGVKFLDGKADITDGGATGGVDILDRLGLWKPKKDEGTDDGESVSSANSCACKHKKKLKSGMLDKATANIEHKEIWPQKNLVEDYADAELDFKQMQYEHFVAGESRTIEMCNDRAQILGRLRLLRRISYLKLRGNEWPRIRTMYAAIVRSIETGECSWESNFDRFEGILNVKLKAKVEDQKSRRREGVTGSSAVIKDWYCRAYNKPEGCQEPKSHWARIGNRDRFVQHVCASCLLKEGKKLNHPEGHADCKHAASPGSA